MGEAVPRLPPRVAPLRISRDANCGQNWSSSGIRPSSSRSASDRVSAAPISISDRADVERAQLGQLVDGHHERGPGAAQVDLDAPVGAPGDDRGVRPLGQQRDRRGQVGGPDEFGVADPHPGGRRGGRGRRAALGERVVRGREVQRVGGVADRAVSGAAAQVPAHRVQVEPVRPVLMVGRPLAVAAGIRGGPVRPVVLGGHRADEAGRAVAALGAAAVRHLPLHRVQRARRAETLGGDQLLAIQREHRHQARVQCGPEGATVAVGPGHHHRAGAALALRAALLGAGQPLVAQPVERGDVRLDIDHRALLAVDHNRWVSS